MTRFFSIFSGENIADEKNKATFVPLLWMVTSDVGNDSDLFDALDANYLVELSAVGGNQQYGGGGFWNIRYSIGLRRKYAILQVNK